MVIIESFSTLTWIISGIIAVLLIYFHGPVYSAHTANYSPSILTSIGIFGTFLGVALGLADFDPNAIENSIPQLLEGLKTAFWTSIIGLMGALSIKFRYALASMRVRAHRESKLTATMDDLAWHLQRIGDAVDVGDKPNWTEWRLEQDALQHQRHEKLLSTLLHYQTEMTEANQTALEKAIGHVMREFNTRIEEQYGDNFKRLNDAVGQMLVWQDGYKKQLEALLDANERSAQSSTTAAESFERLITQTRSFTSVAEDMETEEEFYLIYSSFEDFNNVRNELEAKSIAIESAETPMIPKNTVDVSGKDAEQLMKLMENLDDHDDVQNVFANFEIDEAEMERLLSE
jgi:hypothetical protein